MLDYFELDPWIASVHQNNIPVSRFWYHYTRTFMLARSATMKWCMQEQFCSNKMPGDDCRKVRQCAAPGWPFMCDPSRHENHLHGQEFGSAAEGMSGGILNGICSSPIPIQGC